MENLKEKENEKLLVLQREAEEAGILLPTYLNRKANCPCTNKANNGGEVEEDSNFLPRAREPKF